MSMERLSAPLPAETPPTIAGQGDITAAMRLQILSTEHWSLLATRSLAWNEVFARAAMHLSALSGAIVALALVGQGSGFGEPFLLFGIAILPVVLLVGIGTFLRLAVSNMMDATCVVGMNRIRAGYLQFAPELEPFFVTGVSDDAPGVALTLGTPTAPTMSIGSLLSATPTVVAILNSVTLGALLAFVLLDLHAPSPLALAAGVVIFGGSFVAHGAFARRRVAGYRRTLVPAFPRRDP